MKTLKPQHRVTRTRLNGCKLLEFRWFWRPLWIRRVLVRAQEGQLVAAKAATFFLYGTVYSDRVLGIPTSGAVGLPGNPVRVFEGHVALPKCLIHLDTCVLDPRRL